MIPTQSSHTKVSLETAKLITNRLKLKAGFSKQKVLETKQRKLAIAIAKPEEPVPKPEENSTLSEDQQKNIGMRI